MNKFFIKRFILIVGLSCAYFPVQLSAAPIVNLTLLGGDIYVGDNFDVEVWADGDGIDLDLLSFGFDLNLTGTSFTYDSYTVGSKFDDDSSFVPPEIAGSAFPGVVSNDVLLATLSFTATIVGTGTIQTLGITDELFLGLSYEIDEPDFGWYDIDASLEITVNSTPDNFTPEPSELVLLCSGAMVMIGVRRKQKINRSNL